MGGTPAISRGPYGEGEVRLVPTSPESPVSGDDIGLVRTVEPERPLPVLRVGRVREGAKPQ
jgi:hypothetical protein